MIQTERRLLCGRDFRGLTKKELGVNLEVFNNL